MKLSEFVKKRRAELGLTWNDIMDGGIAHNTFSRIVNDKQLTMKASTMEKLARVLKCTIGELQACMAEAPNPLREEAERQEGTAGINITARAVKIKKDEVDKVMREKPYAAPEPEPDPEEPAEVFRPEPEEEVDVMFPVETASEETLAEFKARMKDMCLYEFTAHGNLEEAKILIAENLLEELLK